MYYEIKTATKQHYSLLIQIWEKSVRATHHFLAEADIQDYKPLILNTYFDKLSLYYISHNEQILGFIGLDEQLIQMLFIDPAARGQGLGKSLITFAIQKHEANSVDVNEQNEQAVGFYKHLGFEVTRRFEEDAAGKPYPILCMKISTPNCAK